MATVEKTQVSVDVDVEKWEPQRHAEENGPAVPQKIKYHTTQLCHFWLYIPKNRKQV